MASPKPVTRSSSGSLKITGTDAGQRLMDIQLAGKVLATVDTFNGAKGKPHGYLFPATTDQKGELWIRILPNPAAPDKNPALCGLLLFSGDARVEVEDVIANRGPEPLAQAIPGYIEPQFFQNRGQYFAHKTYVPKPLPKFAETRSKLPSPIYDEDPACVEHVLEGLGAGLPQFPRARDQTAASSRSSSTRRSTRTSSCGTPAS